MVNLILFLALAYADPLSTQKPISTIKYVNDLILFYPTFTIFLSIFLVTASVFLIHKLYVKWSLKSDVMTLVKSRHFREKEFESLIN